MAAAPAPPHFLASLGVALSRLDRQLAEASQAYKDCLARYEEERQQLANQGDCDDWGEEAGTEAAQDAGEPADGAPDLWDAEVALEAGVEDVLPPASLPEPARTAFFVARALPAPRGDACPTTPLRAKVVRLEAEHGAVDQAFTTDKAFITDKVMSEVDSEPTIGRSSVVGLTGTNEKMIAQRLLARLGKRNTHALITGHDLHQAVSAMGLERYSLKEMDHLVYKLSLLINLEVRHHPEKAASPAQAASHEERMVKSSSRLFGTSTPQAHWTWPDLNEGTWQLLSHHAHGSHDELPPPDQPVIGIPIKALVKAMTAQDFVANRLLGAKLSEQLFAIKEVLVTGEANRLVSELTCVRIDDLATRTPEPEVSKMEILLGAMIIANGVMVGVQTDDEVSDWVAWFWLEVSFTAFFAMELLLRHCVGGWREFLFGTDYGWNLFDALLVLVGIVECILSAVAARSHVSYSTMVRFFRLLKLMRLVRVFRLRFMWELQLMIKGLLGGARTLCWAIVLLVFVLYILAVLTYSAFSNDPNEYIREVFENIPTAMFTCFCCVTGDCLTRDGTSILHSLLWGYGLPFGISFFIAYIAIALGVFNVILAIYVETTMTAAKQTEDANKGSKERASIRVAHLTKRLLKLFCAAERSFNCAGHGDLRHGLDMKSVLASTGLDSTELQESTSIPKELFLMVIQEPEVKKLMDELDLPPDRANLFDSIDADGSGSLEATELVRGLLKVRGEVKKSDQVACILALRAVQSSLREMDATLQEHGRMLQELRGGACAQAGPG